MVLFVLPVFTLTGAGAQMASMNDQQLEGVNGENNTLAVTPLSSSTEKERKKINSRRFLRTFEETGDESKPVEDKNTIMSTASGNSRKVIPAGFISKDIHTHTGGTEVLFNMNVRVQEVIEHYNNTRVVETWDGNRTDFNHLYNTP